MKIKNAVIVATLLSFASTSCDSGFFASSTTSNNATNQPSTSNTGTGNNNTGNTGNNIGTGDNNNPPPAPEDNKTSFTIRWVNYDDTLLLSTTVSKGVVPEYNGSTPTRDETTRVTYTFKGWTPDIVAATKDTTYKAVYTETPKKYTATFLNSDNSVFKVIENVDIGTKLTEAEVGIPTRPTNSDLYDFSYWGVSSPSNLVGNIVWCRDGKFECLDVDTDITYKANYEIKKVYAVFQSGDEVLFSTELNYNFDFSDFSKSLTREAYLSGYYEPVKVTTSGEAYDFLGWNTNKDATTGTSLTSLGKITASTTYYAIFSTTKKNIMVQAWAQDNNGVRHDYTFTKDELVSKGKLTVDGAKITKFNTSNLIDTTFGGSGTNVYINDSSITEIGSATGIEANNLYMTSIKTIAANGLKGCSVTNVVGANVTSLGSSAFENASNLKSFSFPKLTSIPSNAFKNCSGLEKVTFSDSDALTTLNADAFYDCKALKTINLGSKLATYTIASNNAHPFYGCTAVETLTVSSNNSTYLGANNALIAKSNGQLIYATNGTTVIPSQVKTIKTQAFRSLASLSSLTIPNTVNTIYSQAFYACQQLTNITFNGTEAQLKGKCSGSNVKGIFYKTTGQATITIKCSDKTITI